ncbi:Plasma membrane sulfite pump involved in sulfite metabolism [Basidiobolus ranarum]|uniref:Plasma membrane sulfite pump involved in sulfite metabolism n=1 Tax=Basidiobolus ranarum TaxID=34480 RepID=A0ABR2WRG3_9FUNG
MFPEVIPAMLKHNQSVMLSTIPMGLTTITNYTILVLVPTHSWALELAYVLWWIEFCLTILSIIGIPFCMMLYQEYRIETMNGSWLLPLVPAVVTGASGCYLSRFLETDGHRAIMILTISAITLGCGLSLAFPVIGIYFYRLVVHSVPGEDVIITSFLPVGPLGQGTYGIIQLGWACQKVIGDNYGPGFGNSAFTFCMISAFFLWGYGLWYLCFALISVSVRSRSRVPFNMGWWALTFPLGVFTAGTLNIAIATDSTFFRVLASIFVCCLVIIWICVTARTFKQAYSGKIFNAPCLHEYHINGDISNTEMQECNDSNSHVNDPFVPLSSNCRQNTRERNLPNSVK